jgi:cytoskeletal protein RodZ
MATALRRDPIVRLGEFLRAARERAGLTLQQVSSTTKIPQRHLDAIEHGDLSVVPQGPYRRGEVRAFAQAVGLDQKVALAQLEEALPEPPPVTVIAPPEEPIELRGSWIAFISLLVAVAGLTMLLLWNRDAASTPSVTTAATAPQTAATAPPSVEPSTVAPTAVPVPPPPRPSTATPASAPRTVAAPISDTSPGTPAVPAVEPTLVITSDPPGARVVVDGIGRGTTPAKIELLALGEHGVRIVRDGYVSGERSVNLTLQRPTATLHVELQPTQ